MHTIVTSFRKIIALRKPDDRKKWFWNIAGREKLCNLYISVRTSSFQCQDEEKPQQQEQRRRQNKEIVPMTLHQNRCWHLMVCPYLDCSTKLATVRLVPRLCINNLLTKMASQHERSQDHALAYLRSHAPTDYTENRLHMRSPYLHCITFSAEEIEKLSINPYPYLTVWEAPTDRQIEK